MSATVSQPSLFADEAPVRAERDADAWDRGRLTYGGGKTTAREAVWFSPACRRVT